MKTITHKKRYGKTKIGHVIKYLEYQRSITANVSGDNFAGFYMNAVPGAEDEPSFHIARSILKKLENEGYIKFTDTTSIKELENFCVVEFLPKYKWIKFKYFSAIDFWQITNPFWLVLQFTKAIFLLVTLLWNKSRILTSIGVFIMTLLVYEWALAWQNIKIVLNLLSNL